MIPVWILCVHEIMEPSCFQRHKNPKISACVNVPKQKPAAVADE